MNGSSSRTTVISRAVVRIVIPIILVTVIALLFHGYNLPGGDLIGAVFATAVPAFVYIIFGLEFIQHEVLAIKSDGPEQHRLVETYRWMASLGPAIAMGSSPTPFVFGVPFLTQDVLFLGHLPLYGGLEAASAFTFDLDVFFAVVDGLFIIVTGVDNE